MAEKTVIAWSSRVSAPLTEANPSQKPEADKDSSFLDQLAVQQRVSERLSKAFSRLWSELETLRSEARWQDILDLIDPPEECFPELVEAGFGPALWGEAAFALCQLKKYDAALDLARRCVRECPDDYQAHARVAYIAYESLYAAKNGEVLLHPQERKARMELAHQHFAKAQELRPDNVTQFYRRGMLYKKIQNKPDRALPLFRTAVGNWDALDEEQKKSRHQERKNVIKSLYQWASCLLELGDAKGALNLLTRCLQEDSASEYLSLVHKYFALGKVHYAMGDLKEAEKALDFASSQADPANHDYVFELRARVALAQSKVEEAEKTLNRIPAHRKRPYVLWTEADVLVAQGRLDQAKGLLKKAADKDRRGRHKALVRLAKIAFRQNTLEKCLQWAREASAFTRSTYQNPHDEALFWESAALYRLGRYEEAWQVAEELSAFRPVYPHLKELKKRILQEMKPKNESSQGE